ncbi:MAG: hypothetical protein PHQ60_13145 [Sideroxydans sp.]|nr:hypothetical protein [Sideroxydans sp.]
MNQLIPHTAQRPELPLFDSIAQALEPALDFKTFLSLRRMVAHQQNQPQIGRADFLKQVTLYLPEVAARIEDSDFGSVHLEVGAMKLATNAAIKQRDWVTVRGHLFMMIDLYDRADAELQDALRISYLEALFLGETSASYLEARSLLSRPIENMLRQSELRWKKLRAA